MHYKWLVGFYVNPLIIYSMFISQFKTTWPLSYRLLQCCMSSVEYYDVERYNKLSINPVQCQLYTLIHIEQACCFGWAFIGIELPAFLNVSGAYQSIPDLFVRTLCCQVPSRALMSKC